MRIHTSRRVSLLGLCVAFVIVGCAKDEARTTVENSSGGPVIESPKFAAPPVGKQETAISTPAAPIATSEAPAKKRGLAGLLTSASSPSSSSSKPAPSGTSLDERLLFFPVKYPGGDWQPTGLRIDDVEIRSADGTKLHGWYCPATNPTAVILYCHGNGGNLTYDAPVLRFLQKEARATVLEFDYRGYGRSDGRPTAEGVVADARAARAWLAQRAGVPESQIVLMGRSLGGAVAVQLTADVRPRGLILESTFASLRAVAEHHYPLLASIVPADKLDSAAVLAGYDGPLLQSHGDKDRTIPFASGEALFLAAKGKKQFVPISGADHNAPQSGEYYWWLLQFLKELP
jgi:fermentation-respiration switch protein FrsA (DUF1100 family)